MKYFQLIFFILFLQTALISQNAAIDSLQAHIKVQQEDSNKVKSILELSKQYFDTDPKEAIRLAESAVVLGHKIGYTKGAAYGLKNVGIAYYYQGNYIEAISLWKKSLAVFDSIHDQLGVANILSNLGATYYNEGDYNKALDHYLRSLKVSEEIKDTLRIVTALLNIGAVYIDKPSTHAKALEYSEKALELSEKIEYKEAIATSSVNIGEIHFLAGKYDLALQYFEKSLKYTGGTDGTVYTMVNISNVYSKQGKFNEALKILEEAITIADKLNAKPNKAHALVALAETYRLMDEEQESIKAYKQASVLAVEVSSIKDLEKIYLGLNQIYFGQNRYDSAYKYQQLLMGVKDSLYNIETDKILSNQMFNFQIEKKQSEINLLTKDKELKELDIQKQKIIKNLIAAGFVSVIIFLVVALFQKRRITKEKERSEELLLNILPKEIADELKENGKSDARNFSEVTVLFTDFKEFTGLSQVLNAKDLVEEINYYFKAFDGIMAKYEIEKIKTIGDAYMAASGLPNPETHSVKNVIFAAFEMQEVVLKRQKEDDSPHSNMFNMRLGLHTGPVVAGIVGVKKFQYDIWGDTVNTASRMESSGEVGMVNISEFTYELVKDAPEFEFEMRGKMIVKGKGEMQMYFVKRKA